MPRRIVKFSGGKDSLATLLKVRELYGDAYEIVFCDTGWEHEKTYAYLAYIEEKLGKPIRRIKNKKFKNGFVDQARKKGRFASQGARFCTIGLKVEPSIDYVLSLDEDVIIYQGIRAEESAARRMMKRNDEYFKFYTTPTGYKGKYDKEIKLLEASLKAGGRGQTDIFAGASVQQHLKELHALNLPTLKPQYHTYRRSEVLGWLENYTADQELPILHWTAEETVAYVLDQGFKLNPLYYEGAKRVGCFPCVMSSFGEIASIAELYPERIAEIAGLELSLTRKGAPATFFHITKVPAAFRDTVFERKGEKFNVATIRDVVRYVSDNADQAALFDAQHKGEGCLSYYNICERA